MTVSRFFRHPEKLTPSMRDRVGHSVQALQYVPNQAARSLVEGSSTLLALLVADVTNPFFSMLARGVEDEARRQGYPLILGNTDESPEREGEYLTALLSHQINGVVVAPSVGAEPHLASLSRRGIPFVLVDRNVPGVTADLVRADTREGAHELVNHLIRRGHTDIAFVGGDPRLSSLQDRLGGYQSAMEAAGLAERVHLSGYLRQSGEEVATALVDQGPLPDAVLAANYAVAAGLLGVFKEQGIRVPDDVAVACVDEAEPSLVFDPFLTAVRQPAFEIGRVAMRALADRIRGDDSPYREVVLKTDLVIRRST